MESNIPCNKCGSSNWSFWTSSTSGKTHRYCKTCRQFRAKTYNNRKNKAKGFHTKTEWLKKLKQFDNCPNCSKLWSEIPLRPDRRYKYVWTKDHILPLHKGGDDSIENIQPLCYRCNFGKR